MTQNNSCLPLLKETRGSAFLESKLTKHSLQGWRQHFGIIGCSSTLKDRMAAAWSSYSLHPWRRGRGLLLLAWDLLDNVGQEELSRTTQGRTLASNAALGLAGAQGKHRSAWGTAIHCPMRSPRTQVGNAHRKRPRCRVGGTG